MSDLKICTTKSLRAGIDLPPMVCSYCKHETLYPDWVSARCDTCGYDVEHYTCDNIRIIRQKMNVTRVQIADALGYSKHTVKKYEFNDPSNSYWHKFKLYVEKHYNNQRRDD